MNSIGGFGKNVPVDNTKSTEQPQSESKLKAIDDKINVLSKNIQEIKSEIGVEQKNYIGLMKSKRTNKITIQKGENLEKLQKKRSRYKGIRKFFALLTGKLNKLDSKIKKLQTEYENSELNSDFDINQKLTVITKNINSAQSKIDDFLNEILDLSEEKEMTGSAEKEDYLPKTFDLKNSDAVTMAEELANEVLNDLVNFLPSGDAEAESIIDDANDLNNIINQMGNLKVDLDLQAADIQKVTPFEYL